MSRTSSPTHEETTNHSPEPVPPEVFSLLRQMTDSLKTLSTRMDSIEARQAVPTAPQFGANFEVGGTSNAPLPRAPLVDQATAYQQARSGGARASPAAAHASPQGRRQQEEFERQEPYVRHQRENFYAPNSPLNRNFPNHEFQEFYDQEMEEEEWRPVQQRHYQPRRREMEQDGIGKIKVKIPSFEGKCDPDVYLEWETKIEQIWSCHNFPEAKKVQLAALNSLVML